MNHECPKCSAFRVKPVLDRRQQRSPIGGNPYRSRCFGCGKWLQLISKEDFKTHPDPYVLPLDGDPSDDSGSDLVPLAEYEYKDEIFTLFELSHKFDCPECGVSHTGFPRFCSNCAAEYRWNYAKLYEQAEAEGGAEIEIDAT